MYILFFILLMLKTVAQEPRQYSFSHYTTSSGLLSNQVFSSVQDEDEYIWIAGTDGLQRFDGVRYKSFRHKENDIHSLPSSTIMQLMLDKKKRLWLLMFDGTAGIFDKKKFKFSKTEVTPKKSNSVNTPVKRLITDEEGNIFYLLQGNELLTWNEKRNEF